jgi:hypothetical protein
VLVVVLENALSHIEDEGDDEDEWIQTENTRQNDDSRGHPS